jgi:6-pyruvoyltetrahydropterin/6-carboxytetrahydropterin synthase
MYRIGKEIHFCYGHRLLHHSGKCRHLHGHNARAIIRLECQSLNESGMVCDFADLGGFVRDWLEREIDHTLLLHREDPILPLLQGAGERCYVMECAPTAENIARLIFDAVAQAGFPVVEVTLYETASAFACYTQSL